MAGSVRENDGIAQADRSHAKDCRINADVSLVGLDRRAEHSRVFGQVALAQRCHHATRTGSTDPQLRFPDGECPSDPRQHPEGHLSPAYTLDDYLTLAREGGYLGAWPWSFKGVDAFGATSPAARR